MDKILSRWHTDIYFFFFPENRFDISCKLSPKGNNLHEMSNPVFWKNEKNINLLSAELPQRVLKIKLSKLTEVSNCYKNVKNTSCPVCEKYPIVYVDNECPDLSAHSRSRIKISMACITGVVTRYMNAYGRIEKNPPSQHST